MKSTPARPEAIASWSGSDSDVSSEASVELKLSQLQVSGVQGTQQRVHQELGPVTLTSKPKRRATSGVMDARGELDMDSMSSTVEAAFRGHSRQQMTGAVRTKDRADRATSEQVLDPRTLYALQKMRRAEVFEEMNGVLATGKEANVYHATTLSHTEIAIKIFKTSILVFKDRDRYVTGDFRFRTGYCRSNPRKMVKAWAEKERRNLARINSCGIRSPKPLHLRMHVLAMEFIGSKGVSALRLKDAKMSKARTDRAYQEMVRIIRQMYQEAHLVHADLSEWNVLFHEDELYIIDVGQAVDLDHPHCLEFLREDALHINQFFQKLGVATLTIREVFDYAVDPSIPADGQDAALQQLLDAASSRPAMVDDGIASAEEEVFRQAYIPRRLGEVADHEGDYDRLAGGQDTQGIYYQSIAGMKADMSGAQSQSAHPSHSVPDESHASDQPSHAEDGSLRATEPELQRHAAEGPGPGSKGGAEPHDHPRHDSAIATDRRDEALSTESSGDSDASSSTGYGSDGSDSGAESGSRRHAQQDSLAQRDARKAHKKLVKADNKERRKTKMPKHVKKRAEKKHKRK
ncbi:hypothetical protein WJX84_003236 [Apatococcus fuscideae]|uniref:Serine/threonine-protein kinase RIO1 n=1 Tax=Apatococcus fuscideae TaxID=2026836 RepID=A0AAW1RV45_9CHLO